MIKNNNNINSVILGCFTRSLDKHHLDKYHLISSVLILDTLKSDDLNRLINNDLISKEINEKLIIIIVIPDTFNREASVIDKEYSTVITITLSEFIGHLNLSNNEDSIFEQIFGKKNLEHKIFDLLYQNSLFIFINLTWSNIVLTLKISDVNISGGSISKRHIFNSVNYQLFSNLYALNINHNEMKKIIYNSSKSPILSNSIPIDFYNRWEEVKPQMLGINNRNISKILNDKFLLREMSDYKYFLKDADKQNIYDSTLKFIEDNMSLAFENLSTGISKHYEEKILNLNTEIKRLEHENESLQYEKDKVLEHEKGLPSSRSSSEKKRLKKERLLILSENQGNRTINNLNLKMDNNLKSIERFKNEYLTLKEDVKKYMEKIESKSLKDLIEYSNKHKIIENNKIKLIKNIKKPLKINKVFSSNREYSTYCKDNSNNLINTELSLLKLNESMLNKKEFSIESKELINNVSPINKYNIVNDEYFNSVFFTFLNSIIINAHINPTDSQKLLENKWKEIILENLDNFKSKSRYNLKNIINIAEETLTLKKSKKRIQKKYSLIFSQLSINHLIICYSLLSIFYDKLGYTSLAIKIGNDILFDIFSKEWQNKNKMGVTQYITFNDYINELGIDKLYVLNLGSFFIEIFCSKPTQIFDRVYKLRNNEENSADLAVLEVNEEYFKFMENNKIITPVSLPMLCPPNKWSRNEFGGFLQNLEEEKNIITGSLLQNHKLENRNSLYSCINKLNSIKFKINTLLLNYLENEGIYLLKHFFSNIKNKTEKNQNLMTLNLAMSYSKFDKPFYISTIADWRGRIYAQSFYLSYQGSELSLSLINLYEGYPLNESGLNYLKLYGANCYDYNNLSKKSFNERLNWVSGNHENILSLNKEFILKAKNIFLFTSFCLNYREYFNNKSTLICVPVFLDATCSGIQHLSALIKDLDSAKKVNLGPQSKLDKVEDIYSELIKPINNAIHNKGIMEAEFTHFKDLNLNRSNLKLPIMTKVYNVSVVGMADQLEKSFEKIKINKQTYFLAPGINNEIKLSRRDIYILAEILNKEIFKSLPYLKSIYDYFQNMAKFCIKSNLPLIWITPAGLKITQMYNKTIQNKVSISFKTKAISVILRNMTKKIDSRKQVQSIIPNIIHSLDASHLMNIINQVSKYPVLTIHDCFGSHPNFIEELKFLVTIEFVKLYSNTNFLELLHQRILQNIEDQQYEIKEDLKGKFIYLDSKKIYIPNLPTSGNLNLNEILKSEYLIT